MGALGRVIATAALVLGLAAGAARAGFIRDAEIERTLSMMSRPIFEAAGVPPDSVRLLILDDPALNAFVAGGRNMVLYTGLMRRMDRPETLIGVIAHETGHIVGGHLARRSVLARETSGPALLATILATAAAGAAGGGEAGVAAALGSQSAIRRAFLAYSRGEEAAADQAALTYMNRAGIDPSGMLDILRLFKGQEVFAEGRIDPYAQSHPLSSERITLLEQKIAQSPARGRPTDPEIAYWHERMRAKLDGFIERPERVLDRVEQSENPRSEANLMRRAVAEHRLARPSAALDAMEALLKLRPNDPFYLELKGQILFESARPADAVAPLRRAVALAPGEPLIAGLLGRALLASGQPGAEDEALRILQDAAREDPGEAGILRDLAMAYARAGDDGMAALTTAERVAMGGDLQTAASLARRAMGLLPRGSPGWLRADDIAALTPETDR